MSIARAREVLRIEAEAIRRLIPRIGTSFEAAVNLLVACKGRVAVTGMGKAGLIGQKLSATLASTGTPSHWVHPAEAIHGDLGRVTRHDVVIALSNSGETEELTRLLPVIKRIGSRLIALTGHPRSTLARYSDVVLDVSVTKEACSLNLAPTSSTTAMLAMGDALAVVVAERRGFKERDFALLHPGGQLGRRLLGIFTDGDLRRHLHASHNLAEQSVRDVMTHHPKTIGAESLAAEALRVLREHKIDELVVVDGRHRPIGLLDVQDLLKAGF